MPVGRRAVQPPGRRHAISLSSGGATCVNCWSASWACCGRTIRMSRRPPSWPQKEHPWVRRPDLQSEL